MQQLLIAVFTGLLIMGCNQMNSGQEANNGTISEIETGVFVKTAMLDKTKFPANNKKSIEVISSNEYELLPLIEVEKGMNSKPARYYCDNSFSRKFNTYLIAIHKGDECEPTIQLINCKGDSILSQIILAEKCKSKNGEQIYRTEFKNKSTFTVFYDSSSITESEVKGQVRYDFSSETYKITSDGTLELIDNYSEWGLR